MTSLKINSERLNSTLQSTCSQYGALANSTGMRRLSLSQEDKEVRDWLVTECKALGCEVKIDQMGNVFAIRPGTSKDRKPIAMGSHLDTQPAGITPCYLHKSNGNPNLTKTDTTRWPLRRHPWRSIRSRSPACAPRNQLSNLLSHCSHKLDQRRGCPLPRCHDVLWGLEHQIFH